MIIIGEKLNSSIPAVQLAIKNRDKDFLQSLARKQVQAGAQYLDLNAGMFYLDEPKRLQWMVETVQKAVAVSFVFDSPNERALECALQVNQNGKPILNSVTADPQRLQAMIPLVTAYHTGIIALCMDAEGIPSSADARVAIADRLINTLTKKGIALPDIYIDPIVIPVATSTHSVSVVLETIHKLRLNFPELPIVCGLSNISHGLPNRSPINQAFLSSAMVAGLNCAILDPLDTQLMQILAANLVLIGQDASCMHYIAQYRNGASPA